MHLGSRRIYHLQSPCPLATSVAFQTLFLSRPRVRGAQQDSLATKRRCYRIRNSSWPDFAYCRHTRSSCFFNIVTRQVGSCPSRTSVKDNQPTQPWPLHAPIGVVHGREDVRLQILSTIPGANPANGPFLLARSIARLRCSRRQVVKARRHFSRMNLLLRLLSLQARSKSRSPRQK